MCQVATISLHVDLGPSRGGHYTGLTLVTGKSTLNTTKHLLGASSWSSSQI